MGLSHPPPLLEREYFPRRALCKFTKWPIQLLLKGQFIPIAYQFPTCIWLFSRIKLVTCVIPRESSRSVDVSSTHPHFLLHQECLFRKAQHRRYWCNSRTLRTNSIKDSVVKCLFFVFARRTDWLSLSMRTTGCCCCSNSTRKYIYIEW